MLRKLAKNPGTMAHKENWFASFDAAADLVSNGAKGSGAFLPTRPQTNSFVFVGELPSLSLLLSRKGQIQALPRALGGLCSSFAGGGTL